MLADTLRAIHARDGRDQSGADIDGDVCRVPSRGSMGRSKSIEETFHDVGRRSLRNHITLSRDRTLALDELSG